MATDKATPEPTQAEDKAVDDLLDSIVEDDEEDAPAEEEEQPAEEPQEQEEAEDEPDSPPTRSADAQDAFDKLKLSGVSEKALSACDEDELTAWWDRQSKREADVSQRTYKAAALEKELAELKATMEAEPKAEPTANVDLSQYKSTLSDQFGEDAADSVLAAAQGIASEAVRPMQEALGVLPIIADAVGEILFEQARADLGLGDLAPEKLEKVTTRFRELQGSELHGDVTGRERIKRLLHSAARMEDAVASPAEQERKAKVRTMKDRGKLQTGTSRAPAKDLTEEQLVDKKLQMILNGADADEVRRKWGD